MIFEFIYRQNHAPLVSYAISALAICGCFLFGQWPYEQEALHNSFGDRFFTVIMVYTIAVATVLATGHAALSISSEKEKKTLTLLRMSGLGPGEIVFSKAAVSLCFTVFILLPAAPLITICPFLGGISGQAILKSLLILFVSLLFYISAGIFISILFKKSYTCIAFATAFLLILHFGFFIIDDAISYASGASYYSRHNYRYLSAFSPLEMWRSFFDSIQAAVTPNYKPFSPESYFSLTSGESAAIYFGAAVILFYSGVKIFENYLKWREN
ncbi:MAG TPA: ABC transporter permease subunit [Candidatus Wallbacteria bacterium]|nr:ABC transporter permease subunit [Candidatus Wallbacteria bacterium]